VFDPRALRLLIDTMGTNRIMVGSDAPFPLGEEHIGDLVRNQPDVNPADRAAILRDNAKTFFRL
jgi:aminocarboxymuconate-semialdehyde decarboxylase